MDPKQSFSPLELLKASVSEPISQEVHEEIFDLYASVSAHGDGLGYLHKKPILEVDFALAPPRLPESESSAFRADRRHVKAKAPHRGTQEKHFSATINQDPSALASERGNTSAVAWRVSLLLAKLLLLQQHFPARATPVLDLKKTASASVLELGSGTGLLSVLLHPLFRSWTASDRGPALPLLRKNLKTNGVDTSKVLVEDVDWLDIAQARERGKTCDDYHIACPDIILAVDTVYNQALALPLLQTISFYSSASTLVLVVCELRDSDMLEHFLQCWLDLDDQGWCVRRVDMPGLPEGLEDGANSPYVVWAGYRRAVV